jgi:8-oxo-dGTP pyrophosphatase MutT (NUDIX family)
VNALSHAGGVVLRTDDGTTRVLLVTARRSSGEWVLPKGHIEHGESPEECAAREVLEESGVTADVRDVIGDIEYYTPRGLIRTRFYLMAYQSETEPGESRERAWLRSEEAMQRLRWDDARELVAKAVQTMSRSASRRSVQ